MTFWPGNGTKITKTFSDMGTGSALMHVRSLDHLPRAIQKSVECCKPFHACPVACGCARGAALATFCDGGSLYALCSKIWETTTNFSFSLKLCYKLQKK